MVSLLLRQHRAALPRCFDAPEPEGDDGDTVAEQARKWKIAVEQAENVAKLAGKLPAGITRSLEQSEAAGVDWRELLRRAWSETIPSDYCWVPPNRLHIWAGLYLRVSRLKARGRSPSLSIVQDRSIRANLVSSRRRFAPFSKVNGRAGCICSTSIPTSIKTEVYQAGQPIALGRLAEEERTSRPASAGWTNAELCHRPWFSLQTYAEHSHVRLLPIPCCGPPRSHVGHHSGK